MDKEDRFNQIILENKERIQRICNFYIQNNEDRKDLYQEILINIWKSLDYFNGNSAISTYVYRIAINSSLNYRGKSLQHLKLYIGLDLKDFNKLSDDTNSYEKQKKEEHLNKLESEINLLSVIDKALITLLLEDLPMKEIANIVGITEPNVKVKIHRIKAQLKAKMNGGNHGV